MSPEINSSVLLAWHNQEVLVRMTPGGIIVSRLSFKPITTAATTAIDDAIDVDACTLGSFDIVEPRVHAARMLESLDKAHVIVISHHLITRKWLKPVAVCEGQC